jgi:hypothetical protein
MPFWNSGFVPALMRMFRRVLFSYFLATVVRRFVANGANAVVSMDGNSGSLSSKCRCSGSFGSS